MQLRDATVQDIQLELIRRTRFNEFDGERICDILGRYRGHWRAVLLDRTGVPNHREPGRLLVGGLIKLRDLDTNLWNADTLFILTHTRSQARELAAVFDEEGMGEKAEVYDNTDETDMALGMGRKEYGLLSVWWD